MDIRPVQYRDLEAIEQLVTEAFTAENPSASMDIGRHLPQIRQWFGLLKVLSWFPNPYQNLLCAFVAQQGDRLRGMIQVSPFNRTRSTWRVDRVAVDPAAGSHDTGSRLLRYCLEAIWEARTWLLEVEANDKTALGLYRQNGFQPLAQMTYWGIEPELLQELAGREPDLPNLLPVSNADAQLLYQLDTASMPPLVRQVFDRHIKDFKTSLLESLLAALNQWIAQTETVSGYVFETQRKAAIGYFQVRLSRDGTHSHEAELTVHPAYTWLYPELLSQMARITREFPEQSLRLVSADYQPEREEYLAQLGAEPLETTLLMSRSVWHKLREAKPTALEGLQLSEVLGGLQPARKPVPGRMTWLQQATRRASKRDSRPSGDRGNGYSPNENGHPGDR